MIVVPSGGRKACGSAARRARILRSSLIATGSAAVPAARPTPLTCEMDERAQHANSTKLQESISDRHMKSKGRPETALGADDRTEVASGQHVVEALYHAREHF
jgi:hypothetical protein